MNHFSYFAKQLDVLGCYTIRPEPGIDQISKSFPPSPIINKLVTNMQKHIEYAEYAEYDIPTDFARKELIHGSRVLDIELGMKQAELLSNLAHHEV